MNKFLPYLKLVIIALVLSYVVKTFIFNIAIVNGSSMNPTLENKEILFNIVYPKYKGLKQGDIIVFKSPIDNRNYIKRIIALPNQKVSVKHGTVYVDEQIIDESYTSTNYTETINTVDIIVGKDEYFVMGDNRLPGKSTDSRSFGPIKKSSILSKSIFRIFPLSRFGKI